MIPGWSRALALLILCLMSVKAVGQHFDATQAIAAKVQLDSVVIVAARSGFQVEDFIRLVREDESLYLAFRNLRTATCRFKTEMAFTDKRDETRATYQSMHLQLFDGLCRTMQPVSVQWSGDFYKGKRRKLRYYTFALYDRLFLTHGKVCVFTSGPGSVMSQEGAMDRHIDELRNLIFRPGTKSNIPLIGKKTEIFSEEMIDKYDFRITSGDYHGIPCYTFTAEVKADYMNTENKTVFKRLATIFSRSDFQVIARDYTLSQNTAVYLFDVSMHIELLRSGDKYFPALVEYNGTWNIPTKKKESGTFSVAFTEFE